MTTQTLQYTNTTREICEYIGRTYKYGADRTKTALYIGRTYKYGADTSLIYGQCSNALRAKLESRPNHASTIEDAADSIGLLENIRAIMFQFQFKQYSPLLVLHEAKHRFYLFCQAGPTNS